MDFVWQLGIKAGEVKVTPHAGLEASGALGFEWKDGQVSDLSKPLQMHWTDGIQAEGQVEAVDLEASLGFRLGLRAYDAAGLRAGIDAYAVLEVAPGQDPLWETKGGLRGALDAEGPIFSGAVINLNSIKIGSEVSLLRNVHFGPHPANLPAATQGKDYSYRDLEPAGGLPPYLGCQSEGPQLPPGLRWVGCELEGTPSVPGTYRMDVSVRDGLAGQWGQEAAEVNLTVYRRMPAFATPEAAALAWVKTITSPSDVVAPSGRVIPTLHPNVLLPSNVRAVTYVIGPCQNCGGGGAEVYVVQDDEGWHVLNATIGGEGTDPPLGANVPNWKLPPGICVDMWSAPDATGPPLTCVNAIGAPLGNEPGPLVDGAAWSGGSLWWHVAGIGWFRHDDLACAMAKTGIPDGAAGSERLVSIPCEG